MKLLHVKKGKIKAKHMTALEKHHGLCFMPTGTAQSLSHFSMLFFGSCLCRISIRAIVPSLEANHEKKAEQNKRDVIPPHYIAV